MSACKNSNIIFEDLTYATGGALILKFLPGCGICLYIIYRIIIFLLKEPPSLSQDYIMINVCFLCMFGSFAWGVLHMWYAYQTAQKISITNDKIKIRRYFWLKKIHNLDDLDSIQDFKINKFMSQADTFPPGGIGFFIIINDGTRYRISPNMIEFSKLKQVLLDFIHIKSSVMMGNTNIAKNNEIVRTKIEEIINLIDGYNSTWTTIFKNRLTKMPMDENLFDFANDILKLYQGGMGSFTDLVLQKNGKMLIEENDKLEVLKNELYKLCSELSL